MVNYKETLKKHMFKLALINKERKIDTMNKKNDRLYWLNKGFTTESVNMYQLTKENYSEYLSDYQQMLTGAINGPDSYILNNKVVFEKINKNYINIPETIAVISEGIIFIEGANKTSLDKFIDYLITHNITKVIIKPVSDSRGTGVSELRLKDHELYINNTRTTLSELNEYINHLDNYFVSEYIQQSSFGNQLYPHSINSIRILTMVDPITREPFIAAAVQRIGTKESAPTDNFHRGGLSAGIGLETGEINKAASIPTNGKLEWHYNHPDTQMRIQGLKVPKWNIIKKQVINLAQKNLSLKYVGWDIVLTSNGISILEGNSWSDVDLLQIHKPLLNDDRVRSFFKFHNII